MNLGITAAEAAANATAAAQTITRCSSQARLATAPQPPAQPRPDLTVRPVEGTPDSAGLAVELRAAAGVLYARLEDPELTPPPWLSMNHGDRLVHAGPERDDVLPTYVVEEPMDNGANADYIALLHPGVGAVIAKWLSDSAAAVAQLAVLEAAEVAVAHALAVARLINGRPR
ncbi:hypothetical protein [Streptomyces sp. NPDC050738]|uniref:hypothetical protein n=1 Tax=Streptomyces sp. NPDC050738 TaxID=3154744 RepID=UPI00343A2C74